MKPIKFFFRYLFLALGAFTFFAAVFVTLTTLSIGQTKTKNVLAEILDVSKPATLAIPALPTTQFDLAETQAQLSKLQEEKTLFSDTQQVENTSYQVKSDTPKETKELLEAKFASWNVLNTHQNCYSNDTKKTSCNISGAIPLKYQQELKTLLKEEYSAEDNTNTYSPYRAPKELITDIEDLLTYRIALLEIYNNATDSNEYIRSLKELNENQKQIRDTTKDKEREIKAFTHPNIDIFISTK